MTDDTLTPLEFVGMLLPGRGAHASVQLSEGEALFVSDASGALVRVNAPIGCGMTVGLRDDEPSRPLLVIQADASLGSAIAEIGPGWLRSLTSGESVPSRLN